LDFISLDLNKHLSKYIESIFHFKGFNPDHSIERVVPTGHVFLIFELDGFERYTYNNKSLKPTGVFTNVWVSGNHKNYLSISAHQNSEMLVVQLKPKGFYPITHVPSSTLNDKVIPAQELFGTEILNLRTTILNQKTSTEKFEVIEEWLMNRIAFDDVPNSELTNILDLLKTKPLTNHADIISSYSKTQKHLIDQFKKYFGLTPKVFHRIFRFNEILKEIHTKNNIRWSQITYQFGYTDQSHFIKEFKEFSGFNPQEFIVSDFHKEQPNFFPLDRKS